MLNGDEGRDASAAPRPFGRRAGDQVVLTERQRVVLEQVGAGLGNKEIAGRLGISEQAVKQQVSVLLRKFGAPSRAVLARTAFTRRLLGTGPQAADIPVEYLFDLAPVSIAMTRSPEHVFLLANRAFHELFGEREYVGRTLRECFPDLGEPVFAALRESLATGEGYRMSEQRLRYALPDGDLREVFLSFIAQPRRSRGGLIDGMTLYAWDVTERARMRQRLQRLTLEQRTLLEELPVGVIYTDEQGRPILVNAVARRILPGVIDPSSPLSEHVSHWVARSVATGLPAASGSAPAAGAIPGWPYDDDILLAAGENATRLRVSATPLHDDAGEVTGAMLVLTEDTAA